MTPGTKVVNMPWSSSFIYGLVPPATVDAASQCSTGVAKVETQLSFLNYIASAVTFGIYTPMQITVTCASGSSQADMVVPVDSDSDTIRTAVAQGADKAAESGDAFMIRFE